jgi:hypothetical protein
MRTSSFGLLAMVVLAVAVAMMLLTPHDRGQSASLQAPSPFWSGQR